MKLYLQPSVCSTEITLAKRTIWFQRLDGNFGTEIIGRIYFLKNLVQAKIIWLSLGIQLVVYMKELPLENLRWLYFQQDGAPSHNSKEDINYLNNVDGYQWIGTKGPIKWPPRSSELTPLDFYLWGIFKE